MKPLTLEETRLKEEMKADYVHKDSRTLEEKPQIFTRWIDQTIEELKQENQKYKEVIDKIKDIFNNGNFEDGCDCLEIEELLDNLKEEIIYVK